MDPSLYRELVTRRGLKYSYFALPRGGPPTRITVFLLHGYPSTSRDWCKQVGALQNAGYSVVAPDMLGYGGTDPPGDPEQYRYSAMAADLIDILDAEKVVDAVVVGHDWGSGMVARLARYYPERFLAFAFLAAGSLEPYTSLDQGTLDMARKTLGYDLFGYWDLFTVEGAHDIVRKHSDSFFGLELPTDPDVWNTSFAPLGALKPWLLTGRRYPCAAQEDIEKFSEEDKLIRQPVFLACAALDPNAVSAVYKEHMPKICPNLTIREYDDHDWLVRDRSDELNKDLLEWIGGVSRAEVYVG